ncbi:Hypothetical predicted protein [Marmota monax]|uniref:Uncharacterized protein n=1 Tax=Marmota monax TaxID=9995 RepID=A0A5E4A3N1_MARMO|nr:hypothetical protein GHT09_001670 [Marmota monax]VTJ51708.1 Hypothetical predicted protein [Marmota monax]
MKATGVQNSPKSIATQKEAQEQQPQTLIDKKKIQLSRYRVDPEHQSVNLLTKLFFRN